MPRLIAGDVEVACRAVVFDKDGTLLDQDALILTVGRGRLDAIGELAGEAAAARWAEQVGFSTDASHIDAHGPLASAPAREEVLVAAGALYQTGIPWLRAKALAVEAYALADSRSRSPYGASLLPGIAEALERLRRADLRLAVATTDRGERTRQMLAHLGILDMFDTVVTVEDVDNGKPAPDMVLEACRRLAVPPEETVMVGDTETDMRMGRAAGVALCVGVQTGSNRGEGLAYVADVIMATMADLSAS